MRTGGDDWPYERALHRQVYVDLMRAYLADYGTRRRLAAALGVTEAYVSFLLEPTRIAAVARNQAFWLDIGGIAAHELAEQQKYLKSPAPSQAMRIAEQLCTDAERREFLRHHMDMARSRRARTVSRATSIALGHIVEACTVLAAEHGVALQGSDAATTRVAYDRVWQIASTVVDHIDPAAYPHQYVQILLHLHDAACVLDRNDVGLAAARRAVAVLARQRERRAEQRWARLWINALLAEAVSLNNLGLHADALRLTLRAEREPGYGDEPETWQRSFLEQRLTALAGMPRPRIFVAESLAERIVVLAPPDPVHRIRAMVKLLDVHLAHATTRSMRRAGRLADELSGVPNSGLTPLRRVGMLRTLAQHHAAAGDRETAAVVFAEARALALAAKLVHQRSRLDRIDRVTPARRRQR